MNNYRVTASSLELRAGPGAEYPVLRQLAHNTEVVGKASPDAQGWVEVETSAGGYSGWVASRYLAAEPGAPETAPVSPASPECSSDAPGLVFDLSHFNGKVDLAAAYAAGQRGVIHKATEGSGYVDPMYADTRTQAASAGLLWGAYHFGVGGDAQAQARHFLATAKPDADTLLVLDLESNPDGADMSLAEAQGFVGAVHEATGVWSGLYGGSYVRELLGDSHDPVLSQCWFWLAEYGPDARVPATWQDWTLWQYTDGSTNSPHSISGVGDCDRNRFNGDEQQLPAFWNNRGA
jgi:lysozyme